MPYNYLILQDGSLPLGPDRVWKKGVRHGCTSALIRPAGESHNLEIGNILVDPCWIDDRPLKRLEAEGLSLNDVNNVFITHAHFDHQIKVPYLQNILEHRLFNLSDLKDLPEIEIINCPGHSPDSRAMIVSSVEGKIAFAGDALLDEAYALLWQHYWLNQYQFYEIEQTWESQAIIVSKADVVVPGHGRPFSIDRVFLKKLIRSIPKCRKQNHIKEILQNRLRKIEGGK